MVSSKLRVSGKVGCKSIRLGSVLCQDQGVNERNLQGRQAMLIGRPCWLAAVQRLSTETKILVMSNDQFPSQPTERLQIVWSPQAPFMCLYVWVRTYVHGHPTAGRTDNFALVIPPCRVVWKCHIWRFKKWPKTVRSLSPSVIPDVKHFTTHSHLYTVRRKSRHLL